MYTGNKSWAEDLKKEGLAVVEIGIRDEEARIKFGTGIAVLGSEAQYDMFESGQLKVLGKDTAYLEVTAINLPTTIPSLHTQSRARPSNISLDSLDPSVSFPARPGTRTTATTTIYPRIKPSTPTVSHGKLAMAKSTSFGSRRAFLRTASWA